MYVNSSMTAFLPNRKYILVLNSFHSLLFTACSETHLKQLGLNGPKSALSKSGERQTEFSLLVLF